jgi:hypothetical protein
MVKGMEDCKTCYDGTVRNSLDKIVQFRYGDDNIDPCKIEEQQFELCWMTAEQIYDHFSCAGIAYDDNVSQKAQLEGPECAEVCRQWIKTMVAARERIVSAVFNYQNESSVRLPLGFSFTIENVKHRFHLIDKGKVDITPL